MEQTVFNPAQMKILQMMSYIKTPQELDNLENVLSQYFAKKVDEGIDELCDNGSITLDTIESWGNEHLRTSGKLRKIVLDTNCLLMSLPRISPYRKILWNCHCGIKETIILINSLRCRNY